MLASLLLLLNNSTCNCNNPILLQEEPETHPNIALRIIPLDGTQLVQEHGKKFSIKLTNTMPGGDPIDLQKLELKITLSDTNSQVQYNGNFITQLAGSDLTLDQAYAMELVTDAATTQVTITLQLWYDNKQLVGEGSACTLIWEEGMNTVTWQLFTKINEVIACKKCSSKAWHKNYLFACSSCVFL